MAQTGEIAPGLRAAHVKILKWLYLAKKDGKRVQKADYAKELGVQQPQVNPLFNQLEQAGFTSKEGYQTLNPKAAGGGTPKPGFDVKSALGDLDLGL